MTAVDNDHPTQGFAAAVNNNDGTWTIATSPTTNIKNDSVTVTVTDIAGNVTTLEHKAPAGVAGEAINLGLVDPSGGHIGTTIVTVVGVPSGWTLSEGTDNGDGSWTVVTNDVASLSITSPANYTGALVLNVAETWTNADGSTGHAVVADNVEAYAAGLANLRTIRRRPSDRLERPRPVRVLAADRA